MKKAFITGVTGQDGSYLAEFLLEKGYQVHGLVRRSSSFNRKRIEHLHANYYERSKNFYLHYGDMCDAVSIISIIKQIQPDEIYNLAAQSHVHISFETPEFTANTDAIGTLRILEAVRLLGLIDKTKIYQASTSELYGKAQEPFQSEKTPFYPRSPYGVAKLYAYWICKNYREAYNMFVCNGILFNHESPRRGENFVTKKITEGLCRIKLGMQDKLHMGNLNAKRDWGYAKDYIESMWLMLQQDEPDDYVIATGESRSVREFIESCCKELEIDIEWKGEGVTEIGIDKNTGKEIVIVDPRYFRPTETDFLRGDAAKAREKLGWRPTTTFKELVKIMINADMEEIKNGRK